MVLRPSDQVECMWRSPRRSSRVSRRGSRPAAADYATFEEMVEVTRRRLCLPPDARPEVAAALRDLQIDPATPPDLGSGARQVVTLTWPGSAGA